MSFTNLHRNGAKIDLLRFMLSVNLFHAVFCPPRGGVYYVTGIIATVNQNGAPTKLISNVYAYPVYVSKNRYIARGVWEAAPYTVVIYTYPNL